MTELYNQIAISPAEQEIIKRIENLGGHYNPESELSLEDQLGICEAIAEATPIEKQTPLTKESVSVNGSESGGCYLRTNTPLPQNYLRAIEQLGECNYRTPPLVIEAILIELFGPPGKDGHWLYVAGHYNPRQIIWTLKTMEERLSREGILAIFNPGGYFTNSIKYRAKKAVVRKRAYISKPK